MFEKGKEMAASATTTASTADFSDRSSSTSTITTTAGAVNGNMLINNNKDLEFQVSSSRYGDRDEIQSALAKAVELRALHAAALQATRLNSNRYPTPSPVSVSVSKSAQQEDYPVFTPSYKEEPLPAYYQAIAFQSGPLSANWDVVCATDPDNTHTGLLVLSDHERQPVPHSHPCLSDDQKSFAGSFSNRSIAAIRSPHADYIAKSSRRNGLADVNSISSCNKCKPAVTKATEVDNNVQLLSKYYDADAAVPFTDSNLSCRSRPRNRGMSLSWLFPRFKKKKKQQNKYTSEDSNSKIPLCVFQSQTASWTGSELAMASVETLKKKINESRESRDAALMEVSEMRTSLHELRQKLEQVESYCQELRRALNPADQVKDLQFGTQLQSFQKHDRSTALGSIVDKGMPVSEEVLIEGFLQVVSEARSSVKRFCETLLIQIEDADDDTLVDSINTLLQPYNQSLASKYSKLLKYHLEGIINQALYQDFENCAFQKDGSPKLLDPLQRRQAQFASYMALQDLSWNDVLRKGTMYYSPEFSKFCDQKMSSIISLLNWTRPWPEQLLQAFFIVSKSIWLLHLLAFSFNPPLVVLRVEEQRSFDPQYMDDMLSDLVKARGPSRVQAMVMPGFYVKEKVLRCKVICKYKSTSYD